MQQYYDLHCHSESSYDSKEKVKKLCQGAIRASLAGIAITDHCDFGNYQLEDWKERLEKSLSETREAKETFDGRLKVLCGVEFGQLYEDYATALEIYKDRRLDFALASVHYLEGFPHFWHMDCKEVDGDALLESYFTQLYTTSCLEAFDSLSHLTYPLRFFRRAGVAVPDLKKHDDLLLEIFKELAQKEKALELNISELTREGVTMPEIRELKMFKSVGGELVTIGSDCHDVKNLGLHIEKSASILRMAGFEHQTIFVGHKPRLIPLT